MRANNRLVTIILAVIITFIITENYMLSHMKVYGSTRPNTYYVEIFGNVFEYEG